MKLWAQAVQVMLEQTLNIQMQPAQSVEFDLVRRRQDGNFDLAIGVIVSSLLDPSDYFRAWYSADGPQNHAFWNNPKFDEALLQIDREVDAAKRLTLIREAERIMEDDPPLLPICWEKINDAWYNYVKGLTAGLFRPLRCQPLRRRLAGKVKSNLDPQPR